MGYDNEALVKKRHELLALSQSSVPSSVEAGEDIAEFLIDKFIHIEPPAIEFALYFMTIAAKNCYDGVSRKPGNIVLNWRKLMDVIPDSIVAVATSVSVPSWVLPFVGLYVWNKIWCGSEEKLTEIEATIIYALWKNRNRNNNKISEDSSFKKTNLARREMNLLELSRTEFDLGINRLLKMRCIEIENGVIWLREWVKIEY